MMRISYCISLVFVIFHCNGQQIVRGSIIDQQTRQPLPGVNMSIPYSLVGTSTSNDGTFELALPRNTTQLLITSVGYQATVLNGPFSDSTILIALASQALELSSVNIAAKVDKKWKQQFKKFERQFIGSSKRARKCKILNPWVVDFKTDANGVFTAAATAPIIIENRATGYLINFHLELFSKKGDVVTISGKPYFTEQLSDDQVIKEMQIRSRASTYRGTKAHFLFALQMNLLEAEGFEVYAAKQNPVTGQIIGQKRIKRSHIYANGELTSQDLLKIVYTKEEDGTAKSTILPDNGVMNGSVVGDFAYQTSYLLLRTSNIALGIHGIPLKPENLVEYGYWYSNRIAELLPNELIPDRLESLRPPPVETPIDSAQRTPSINGFVLENLQIPYRQINQGGPAKDGIPSIDQPRFITANLVTIGADQRVLGINFNGVSKAYPLNIMNWHEIVNDEFAGHPVAITYCPLCGSGIAFDALVNNQRTTFGVSGLLYNSDVLLYDRQSESLWSQLDMQSVSGHHAGKELTYINTTLITWQAWKEAHPETLVLSEQTGFTRDYKQSPYSAYESTDQLMFPVKETNSTLPNKELILGIMINKAYKAYPLRVLKKVKTSIEDTVGGQQITIQYNKEGHSAVIRDQNGKQLPAQYLYWFAWYAFHPNTTIYVP
jgi:hypothetical protein